MSYQHIDVLPLSGAVGAEVFGVDLASDLDAAVEGLVDGAFFNSGQSCCGIERIYVARERFDDFDRGAAQHFS